MIWLAVLLLLAGLGYVLFHKPPLNVMGAGWQPPRLDPPGPSRAGTSTATRGETKALAAGPQPAGLLHAAPDIDDAVTLRLDRGSGSTPAGADAPPDADTAPATDTEVTAVGDEPDPQALAETAEWSAEDAVTAPMAYPAGSVLDGTAGHNAQPLA
jgi:hypothetical protein